MSPNNTHYNMNSSSTAFFTIFIPSTIIIASNSSYVGTEKSINNSRAQYQNTTGSDSKIFPCDESQDGDNERRKKFNKHIINIIL